MPLLTSVKVVTKEQATLNMQQERIIALQASHTEMVKPSGFEDATYKLVLQCLREIVMHLPRIRPPVVPRPPVAPIPPTGEIPLATPKSIDFKGYVVKSPTMLLNNINDTSTEDDLDPLIWVHIPLNNTAWVNVSNPHVGQDCLRDN
jgi:hypothetical protein